MPEIGAGGGAGDLIQCDQLELDNTQDTLALTKVCSEKISDKELRMKTLAFISDTVLVQKKWIFLGALQVDLKQISMPLTELAQRLAEVVEQGGDLTQPAWSRTNPESDGAVDSGAELPRTIVSPYRMMTEKMLN